MLLGVQTSFSSVLYPGTLSVVTFTLSISCVVRDAPVRLQVSLAESLLGWIIYSPVFKQVLPFHPFIMWAVLGLSFALCFESVRSFISLDPGNNLLIPNTLFFPNKRLVYN